MSIREITYYQVVCDWPDCGTTAHDGTDYGAHESADSADEEVDNADWWRGREPETHYCDRHPATWASDHEEGEPFPEPPYLLIHDGDTDNSLDDGRVSLITDPP